MSEFCAHRAKSYASLADDFTDIDYEKHGIINKKAKGTKKCVIQNHITFNDYVNVLFDKTKLIKPQFGFRSTNHEIYREKINKIALSFNDNKRIQCDDGIKTYHYGYYDDANKDVNDYDNLIEKTHAINKRHNTTSKANNIVLEDTDTLLDRMNKLKNKSKKRIEDSNKLIEEYAVINDKNDKTIKKLIITDTCEFNNLIEKTQAINKRDNTISKGNNILLTIYEFAILIENPNELIKTTDDNCENIDILLHDIKNLNDKFDKLGKRSKKGINKFKNLLKSYEVINDNANILIEKLQSIKTNGIG